MEVDICIVGMGPAGIGCALTLSKHGLENRILCLEMGDTSEMRFCPALKGDECKEEIPCQMIHGFGGCSLLSGGKVSSFPAGSNLIDILGSKERSDDKLAKSFSLLNKYLPLQENAIDQESRENARLYFKRKGFDFKYYPVSIFNSEDLKRACTDIIDELESNGVELLFNTEVINIETKSYGFKLQGQNNGDTINIKTKYLILAIGRTGRNRIINWNHQLNLLGKPNYLDVGVRLEFPSHYWPDLNSYHNDLKLLFNNARTFCTCRNGTVATYILDNIYHTEGYFNPNCASDLTNMAIVIRMPPSVDNYKVLEAIKRKSLEKTRGKMIIQNLSDYLSISDNKYKNKRNGGINTSISVEGNVSDIFTHDISIQIKEAISFFSSRLLSQIPKHEVYLYAPELDYGGLSFPINNDFLIISNLYLIGDITGHFRGILQAFCSGVVCAENIIKEIYGY